MAKVAFGRGNAAGQWDVVEQALAGHSAWTKIKTATAGTITGSIWRCTYTYAGVNREFHIANMKVSNTSNVLLGGEGYNTTTDAFIRPLPNSTLANSETPASDGSVGGGAEYPLFSGSALNTSSVLHSIGYTTASTAYSIYAIAHSDGLWVGADNGATVPPLVHVGVFESFYSAEVAPVCLVATGTLTGRVTRFPTVTTSQTNNWALNALSNATWTPPSGVLNGGGDRLHGNRPVASRMMMTHVGAAATHGNLRGLYKNVLRLAQNSDTQTAFGDTLVINGQTWYALSTVNTLAYFVNADAA